MIFGLGGDKPLDTPEVKKPTAAEHAAARNEAMAGVAGPEPVLPVDEKKDFPSADAPAETGDDVTVSTEAITAANGTMLGQLLVDQGVEVESIARYVRENPGAPASEVHSIVLADLKSRGCKESPLFKSAGRLSPQEIIAYNEWKAAVLAA